MSVKGTRGAGAPSRGPVSPSGRRFKGVECLHPPCQPSLAGRHSGSVKTARARAVEKKIDPQRPAAPDGQGQGADGEGAASQRA